LLRKVNACPKTDIDQFRAGEVIAIELVTFATQVVAKWRSIEDNAPEPASEYTVDEFNFKAEPVAQAHVSERAVYEASIATSERHPGSVEGAVGVHRLLAPCA
jgi:hypothetical protein